jgi:alanyl-tRNA synthetase
VRSQDNIYLRDSYELTVASDGTVEPGALLMLASNPFHPQGGGQPADTGTVAGVAVTPSRLPDGRVAVGRAEAEADPDRWTAILASAEAGEPVTAEVDRDARLLHNALHTAGHLIHGLLHRRGFVLEMNNHFPGQARLVLRMPGEADLDALTTELGQELAAAVAADHKIEISYDGDRRLVTIAGIHTEPCGGTHVRSLNDLEGVTLRSVKRKSGTLKIGYEAAHRPS